MLHAAQAAPAFGAAAPAAPSFGAAAPAFGGASAFGVSVV